MNLFLLQNNELYKAYNLKAMSQCVVLCNQQPITSSIHNE